ncbi:hypothetical protein ACYG9R_06635 [Mesorhizobium sp. RSR565B]|uniref:hypothetical protein n=1 Tax=Mesorhizobium sp. L103C565B0 TaxID=1287094 RepID=UPI0012DE36FB|nr:hypothetical protein [Mesorhizobium sp. L103C565B0]
MLAVALKLFLFGFAAAEASEWQDTSLEWAKKAGDAGSKVAKLIREPSPFVTALNKVYGNAKKLKTVTDKTFVSDKDLEQLDTDRRTLDQVEPPLPESLNSRATYEKIAGETDGTVQGGLDQLDRLREASKTRSDEITKLKSDREKVAELEGQYGDAVVTAEKLSKESDKLVGDFPIEFTSQLATGQSFGLSWLTYSTEVIPALQDRHDAAKAAVARYDTVIAAAEKDLKGFDASREYAGKVWTEVASSVTGLDPTAIGGLSSVQLQAMARAIAEGNAATLKAAEELRKEAEAIREHNASISRIQMIVNLGRLGLSAADNSGNKSAETSATPNSIRIDPPPQMDTSSTPNSIRIDPPLQPDTSPTTQPTVTVSPLR